MKQILPILAALMLAGCVTDGNRPAPLAPSVAATKFAPSRFDCRQEAMPQPRDPKRAGASLDDVSEYEDRLAAWGRNCGIKLRSVGRELDANGQLAHPKK